MTVALDTNILIWGLRSQHSRRGNPRQPDLVDLQRRSAILLDMLDQGKERIIIPTITVAELLLGVEPTVHAEFIAELQERFFCPRFDIQACAVAADLWQLHKGLPKSEQLQRTVLSSDAKIIATAKVAGAAVIYSHEPKFRKLASRIMRAEDLPLHHPDIIEDAEFRAAYPNSQYLLAQRTAFAGVYAPNVRSELGGRGWSLRKPRPWASRGYRRLLPRPPRKLGY